MPKIPKKVTGFAHFRAAARYSFDGSKVLFGEAAFRQEILAQLVILGLFWFVGVSPVHYVVTIILFLVTSAVEALNTSLEEIVDLVSPEWSQRAKNAKDLGSFAVLCLLCSNGFYVAFALATTLGLF
ncbi:diacylglycerol kinase [Aliiroseovarius halocynthiae]|uniref:Diacylglycerol kinase n=2 Tax=Aliiroseovarius halocynthiae TaxID=985055 RepID=A0A545SPG3_9RHOB|nr:diacylglycerol kinase [Aliiroseovarius halocynthiae]